jgi:formylglycine-generating enzyme required for sulfatase activity
LRELVAEFHRAVSGDAVGQGTQSSDGRNYPCGKEWNGKAAPRQQSGREVALPDPVDAYPLGAKGNVWQWTDEYLDDHTRFAVLRGGSSYLPTGSRGFRCVVDR